MRHVSDKVSDGVESRPDYALDEKFVPEYYGVYANEPEGTQRWVADFSDRFRAEQYAELFTMPMLVERQRCEYQCPECRYEWNDAEEFVWLADCPVCGVRDIEPKGHHTI